CEFLLRLSECLPDPRRVPAFCLSGRQAKDWLELRQTPSLALTPCHSCRSNRCGKKRVQLRRHLRHPFDAISYRRARVLLLVAAGESVRHVAKEVGEPPLPTWMV